MIPTVSEPEALLKNLIGAFVISGILLASRVYAVEAAFISIYPDQGFRACLGLKLPQADLRSGWCLWDSVGHELRLIVSFLFKSGVVISDPYMFLFHQILLPDHLLCLPLLLFNIAAHVEDGHTLHMVARQPVPLSSEGSHDLKGLGGGIGLHVCC